jgi:hypothetical protein
VALGYLVRQRRGRTGKPAIFIDLVNEGMVREVVERHGGLEVLVTCAGPSVEAPTSEMIEDHGG